MLTSTVSRLSRPRSAEKLEVGVTCAEARTREGAEGERERERERDGA